MTLTNTLFQFEKISRIENYQFPDLLNDFYKRGVSGTIRENIQNSLDAKLKSGDEPVKVTITLDSINKNEIPGIDEIFQHIDSLEGGTDYSTRTINYLKAQKKLSVVPVMTIEDENTIGLSGAHVPLSDSGTASSTYNAYAYQRGIHPKSEDKQFEKTRGGSHGVGKIANNAASDIYLMFFANCDKDGNQHLGGNVQLVEHSLHNQAYRATGYFAKSDVNNLVAYQNSSTNPTFQKKTRGLKNIIPYVRKEFAEREEIIRAICDSFFLSILQGKLVVRLANNNNGTGLEINKDSLPELVSQYYPTDISEMKKNFTPLYVNTYLEKEPLKIEVNSIRDSYNFDLYFDYNLDIPVGRVGIIRTVGMKIADFGVPSMMRRPYNAVLIGGAKEDDFLKTLENESHTDISADGFVDKKEYRNARKFIINLEKKVRSIIEAKMEELNPTDGLINTDDLFYQTKQAFKKALEKQTKLVQLSDNSAIRKKKKPQKEKRKPRTPKGDKAKPSVESRVRKPKKLQDGDTVNAENVEGFILASYDVSRVISQSAEYVSFDLSAYNERNFTSCNVGIKIVDGQGKELDNQFNIQENYSSVVDLNNISFCTLTAGTINGLSIKDNLVQFKIDYKENYNKNLKFIYKVVISE